MRYVYVAQSLDGYIAGPNDDLDWLHENPGPETGDPAGDFGFVDFMAQIDALVMGRRTFERVVGFGTWPYDKPVFVLSRSPLQIPARLAGRAEVLDLAPAALITELERRGLEALYVDGGAVIQSFLSVDLIDRLIVTTLPILLGGGVPLFGPLDAYLRWRLVDTKSLPGGLVQSRYDRADA